MTKAGFWSKDWFLGLAVSFAPLSAGGLQLIQGLERSFEGESMAQLMYETANEHAPNILQHNPALSPAFVALLDKATSKEAGARDRTDEEFAASLRAIFGATVPARPTSEARLAS